MSLAKTKEVECPHCGYANSITIILSPDEKVYLGKCKGCGTGAVQATDSEMDLLDFDFPETGPGQIPED